MLSLILAGVSIIVIKVVDVFDELLFSLSLEGNSDQRYVHIPRDLAALTIGIEAIAVGSLLLRTRIEVGFIAHGDLNRHRILLGEGQ